MLLAELVQRPFGENPARCMIGSGRRAFGSRMIMGGEDAHLTSVAQFGDGVEHAGGRRARRARPLWPAKITIGGSC